jgi:hypothetical protein
MFAKQKSPRSFELEIEKCFDESINLSSVFELFTELSELTPNVNRQRNHRVLSKQNRTGYISSVQKERKRTFEQSNNKRYSFKKNEKSCDRVSVIPQDTIQILKCSREMMINDFSFPDYVDMINMRENLRHDESLTEYLDDEISIGSYETVDSIEYTKARLSHLCHHRSCES